MKVGLIYDPIYLEHDTGAHVENSQRLVSIMTHLEKTGTKEKLVSFSPRPATVEEIETVHSPEYISRIKSEAEGGGGWLDLDTVMCPASYEVALYAAGGMLTAVEKVMKGEAESAFALVRPPGHHATRNRAMGFCIFNNVAIGAEFARANFDVDRILIADFDVHHGNATQETFYADPGVLYFSTHQYPFYPGSGWMDETGEGKGKGYTVNFPMSAGWGDEEYLRAFNEVLSPVARRFQPQLVLVSVGFDAHWADDIAMMQVSVTGFAGIVRILKELALELCQGRLVFTLEGGYNLEADASGARAIFDVLLDSPDIADPLGKAPAMRKTVGYEEYLRRIKQTHHIEG